MSDFLDAWNNESAENAKLTAQESLILEVTEDIWRILEEKNMNKAELAQAMQKSKAHITQLLNGSRNMTLRTLSDICFALGVKPSFSIADDEAEWDVDETVVSFNPRTSTEHKYKMTENVIYPSSCWGKAA